MRWRVFALVSLGVNVVLAVVWLASGRRAAGPGGGNGTSVAPEAAAQSKTNVLLRRQFFSWNEVESPDYPIYIFNMHAIGMPDQTIRDIIIADVNGLYARRRSTELLTAEQQWWKSEPDTNVVLAAAEKSRALEDERRALLAKLLGPNWESGDIVSLPRPSRPGILLDGPLLGTLAPETKQTLQEITMRSDDRVQAYLEAQREAGKTPDPLELAKLRQQTRDELAHVLSPPQLEEFLLRFSDEANQLRSELGQLQFFDISSNEFRLVFRARDPLDQQLQLLVGNDPNTLAQRKALEDQRDNAIRIALGTRRYQEYQMLHDPLYRDAVAKAEEAGTPEAALTIYQVNLAALSTQNAITNSNLTATQKAIEQKQLEADQLRANALATGQDLPPEPITPPPRRTYTLRPGDTPGVISMIYGVPENAIRAANPNINFNQLRPGDSINIPRSAPNPIAPPRIGLGGP
jgi:hypothetical protein